MASQARELFAVDATKPFTQRISFEWLNVVFVNNESKPLIFYIQPAKSVFLFCPRVDWFHT